MDEKTLKLLTEINCAVIKFRGVYALWSRQHGISYNEMLVLYTLRDSGFCTQKQICDNYLLPRQTMNHVFSDMRKRGLLSLSPGHSAGREKAFVLTEKGKAYAKPLLESLSRIEEETARRMDPESVRVIAEAISVFESTFRDAMKKNG